MELDMYIEKNWERGCSAYGSNYDDMTDECEDAINTGLTNEYNELNGVEEYKSICDREYYQDCAYDRYIDDKLTGNL